MIHRRFFLLAALFSVLLMMLAACGRSDLLGGAGGLGGSGGTGGTVSTGGTAGAGGTGGTGAMGNHVIVSLQVTPPAATLAMSTIGLFHATAIYSDMTSADVTAAATWTSSDPMVAAIPSPGTVKALAPGSAVITASYMGVSGVAKVGVSSATIVSIAVTPPAASTAVGGTVTFTATATLSDMTTQDVTATAQWITSDGNVATVVGGVATGVSPGSSTIAAIVGSISVVAAITVTNATRVSIAITLANPTVGAGAGIAFTATGAYSDNSVADLTQSAMWGSSDPMVLSIAPGGAAKALSAGSSVVSASFMGVTGNTVATVTPAALVSIAITPMSSTLDVGGTEQLVATGTYSDNSTADLTQSVLWSSSDATVVSVSNGAPAAGQATALAGGKVAVTAASGGVSGTATVIVTTATLVTITISPMSPTVPLMASVPFKAEGTYSDSSMVDLTTQVVWSTDSAAVATISNAPGSNGLAQAAGVGTTGVHATLGSVSGSTTITVSSAVLVSIAVTPANSTMVLGDKQNMTATGTYSDSSTLDLTTTAAWSTGDATIASVSNTAGAQGLLSAVGAGTTTVTAAVGAVSGSTNVTVGTPTLQQIVVSPIDPSRPAGQQLQFSAIAVFTNNTQQNVTLQAAWSSSATATATIGQHGLASTVASGTTTITATWMGKSGSTTLTVTGAVLSSISVTPIDPTYAAGTVQQFTAMAIFSDNTSQNVTQAATWTSSAPTVAGVTTNGAARGRVTTIAAGTAVITATWMGVSGSSTVTVSQAVIVSISVSPPAVTEAPGTQVQFTAQAIYSDNTSKGITGQATWTSTDPTVASVSTMGATKGLAKALSAGTATLQASYQGITGTATFTVSSATLVTIQVTPFSPTIPIGYLTPFAATGIYSDNSTQDLTPLATWTSTAPSVAAVSDAAGTKGQVTPLSGGTATIQASYMGVTGTDIVTVTNATLVSIAVSPLTASIPVGGTQQFTAMGTFSDMSMLDVTAYVTWLSNPSTVAAVSNAAGSRGQAKALASGTCSITAVRGTASGMAQLTVQ